MAAAQELPRSAASEDIPVIGVKVTRVNVGVTVTDSSGRFLRGLRREDFRVFDNGVEQPIAAFAASEGPPHVLLLIESGTADALLAKAGKSPFLAADALVEKLAPSARVAIVTYSNLANLALDFTPDALTARRALGELHRQLLTARTGAGSLHLSASLAAALDWLAAVPGSKSLVVISTGIDNSPPGTWKAVQEKLSTSDVRVLAVSIYGDFRNPPRGRKLTPDDRENRAFVKQGIAATDQWLAQLTAATGGRSYFPKSPQDFDRAHEEIAQFASGDYSLAFAPPALDGRLHSIQVKVRRAFARVHHRQAYLAPAAALR